MSEYYFQQPYILQSSKNDMFEHTVYYIASVGLSFAAIFLSLEAAWHFTACKIHDKPIKPCFYKQIGILK
jgi:hypothetical protein